ncbi:hypothetical protein QUF63_03440 [Anaerolineales bacterium HSG25]|nr:hypothetical protein [Anaerolineales bacterium HSG25]
MAHQQIINVTAMLTLTLIYLIAFWLTPKTVFWSPDEGAKFLELQTLYRLQQQHPYPLPYQGSRIDSTGQFYPSHPIYPRLTADNDLTFHWPIWFPLLSLLPYQLGGITAIYLLSWLSGLGVAYLSGQIAAQFEARAFAPTMLLVGLASPIFFYSLLFWEHTLAVLLGLLALKQALNITTDGVGQTLVCPHADRLKPIPQLWKYFRFIWLMLLLIASLALRLEMLFYALALVSALAIIQGLDFRSGQTFALKIMVLPARYIFLPLVMGLVVATIMLMVWYQPNLFGTRYLGMLIWGSELVSQPDLWADVLIHLQATWINSGSGGGPLVGDWLSRWGMACLLLVALAVTLPTPGRELGLLVAGTGLAYLSVTVLNLPTRYRTLHGFFLPAPHLLFMALFWISPLNRPKGETVVKVPPLGDRAKLLGLTTLLYLILGTLAVMIRQADLIANLEWGPRYLLMLYPLATICMVVGVLQYLTNYQAQDRTYLIKLPLIPNNFWQYALTGLILGLACIGLGYQWRGFTEIQATKQKLLSYTQTLEQQTVPIVTDIEWLYASLAPHLITKEVYVIEPQTEIIPWLSLTQSEMDQFLFVSFFELSPDLLTKEPYPLKAMTHWQVGQMKFTLYQRIK